MVKQYVKVSNTNTKLGGQIYSINLPAGVTCRPDAPCFKGCYARKGNWLYPSVKTSLSRNLEAYKSNQKLYFESVAAQTTLVKYCRWHSSGDIVDVSYFEGMCKVARKNKSTRMAASGFWGILLLRDKNSDIGEMIKERSKAKRKGAIAPKAYLKKSQRKAASPAAIIVRFAARLYSLSVRIPPFKMLICGYFMLDWYK